MSGPKLVSFFSPPFPGPLWFPSVSEEFLLFSGGLKDGLRHLRNSLKLSFQSAFSSDSSMRASTQRPLKGNAEACSAQGCTRQVPALLASEHIITRKTPRCLAEVASLRTACRQKKNRHKILPWLAKGLEVRRYSAEQEQDRADIYMLSHEHRCQHSLTTSSPFSSLPHIQWHTQRKTEPSQTTFSCDACTCSNGRLPTSCVFPPSSFHWI